MTNGELIRWEEILDQTLILKSNMKPSEWYEANMYMPQGDAFPGPIRYDRTPYWRDVVDCFDPNHPARDITIMGPAQMGKSVMVLNAIVGYTIAMNPCNIIFMTGHSDLTDKAVKKIEFMLQQTGVDRLIMTQVLSAKKRRSGDTLGQKEYRGGNTIFGTITNHNLHRQNTAKITLADDLDAGEMAKSDTGSTVSKIKTRTRAFEETCKRGWISTPQVKGASLIELQLANSNHQLWMVVCPRCGKRIDLRMPFDAGGEMAGLTWKVDQLDRVVQDSVGYICQKCGGFFNDRGKHELLNSGKWEATQEAKELYHEGFAINGLYAPYGMMSWFVMAGKHHLLNPAVGGRKEAEWQTYWNDDVGLLYEQPNTDVDSNELMKNIRPYPRGIIPEAQSIKDGNGPIILLAMTVDFGGRVNDGIAVCEVKAYAMNGASYSVDYFSIGSFIRRETPEMKEKSNRITKSYNLNTPSSMWPEMDEVLERKWKTDTGKTKQIFASAFDVGYFDEYIYAYIDSRKARFRIYGFMGDKEHEMVKFGTGARIFKEGSTRKNLYMINVNEVKDDLANRVTLPWNRIRDTEQPRWFMNFPAYGPEEFFNHYSSEKKSEKKVERVGTRFIWEKKSPTAVNEAWDLGVYHIALVEVILWQVFEKGMKIKDYSWTDFANLFKARVGKG